MAAAVAASVAASVGASVMAGGSVAAGGACVAVAAGAQAASTMLASMNSENIENNNLLVFILFSFVVCVVSAVRSLFSF